MKKRLFLGFLWLGALSMIIMSAHYLQAEKTGILKAKAVADFSWYRLLFFLHVGGGFVAITTGPFQFLTRLRERHLNWHRYLGRLYVIVVGLSGLAGLFIAPHAMGGWVSGTGFALFFSLATMLAQPPPLKGGVIGLPHTHVHWILGREDIGDVEIVGSVDAEPGPRPLVQRTEREGRKYYPLSSRVKLVKRV